MTLRITHKFQSTIPNDESAMAGGMVVPSHWNDDHAITGTVPLSQIDMIPSGTVLGNPSTATAIPTVMTGEQLANIINTSTLISDLQSQIADLQARVTALGG